MYDDQNNERAILIDMLSEETARLTQLVAERRFAEDYQKCKILIKALTKEIGARQNGDATMRSGNDTGLGM